MKLKNILPVLALGTLAFQACDDNKMDWYNPHEGNGVTSSEMPLQLAEKITRYDAIKSYIPRADFQIGLGVGMDLYMSKEECQALVNENFNSITLGNAMKQGSIMNAKGEMNFSGVDAFLEVLPQDIDLYGHNLIWHTQQAANYFKGLIAAEFVPDETGDGNVLDVASLKEGTFGSWNPQNKGAGITIESGAGIGGGNAIKLIASSSSASAWDLQLISPDVPVIEGHTYQLTFMVKSDESAKGRVSFSGLSSNYPWLDWLGTGSSSEAFEYSTTWVEVSVTLPAPAEGSTTFKCQFDFGYIADAVTYIDVNTLKIIDLDAPTETNYVVNGSFENDLEGWTSDNQGAGVSTTDEIQAIDGSKVLKMTAGDADGAAHTLQVKSAAMPKLAGKAQLSFMVRSDQPGKGRVSFSGLSNNYPWMNWTGSQSNWTEAFETSTTWQEISVVLQKFGTDFSEDATDWNLNFDFGYLANVTYYIDNVKVTDVVEEEPATRASTRAFIEKTDEEKEALVSGAMEKWIKEMVGHYKGRVKAWDVLNEPIDDGGKLRGVDVMPDESEMDSDDFYYGLYMGKIYGAKAFMWAREADPTALLFINDYNLEYNLNKCDRLIEYVQYIDQNGGQVDGIGTQMHIAIDSSKDNIVEMFKKLAATGKLVRITELDIKVNTSSPTADNFAAQAEMYQFVIDMYKEHIPEAQQSGITIWGLSDHPDEHVYWIPDDAPNIFDANYKRKHAYKGVCDGLAGRDVSVDFPGDLQ